MRSLAAAILLLAACSSGDQPVVIAGAAGMAASAGTAGASSLGGAAGNPSVGGATASGSGGTSGGPGVPFNCHDQPCAPGYVCKGIDQCVAAASMGGNSGAGGNSGGGKGGGGAGGIGGSGPGAGGLGQCPQKTTHVTGAGFDAYVGALVTVSITPGGLCTATGAMQQVAPGGTFSMTAQSATDAASLKVVLTSGATTCTYTNGVIDVQLTPADMPCTSTAGGAGGQGGQASGGAAGQAGAGG
jgi:hypothetical protein